MRVLVIDDDNLIAQGVAMFFRNDGAAADYTCQGEEGLNLAKLYDYDLIILDLALPDMNGIDLLRRLRAAAIGTPVMILSGTIDIETKLRAFVMGADDYVTKPYQRAELVARARAVVRRSQGHAQSVIKIGEVSVNTDSKTVSVGGETIALTEREYQIVELLATRKGSTLGKVAFLNHMYGGLDEPGPKTIDVFICKIRKKLLAATNNADVIETIWGRGYVMQDPKPTAIAA